VQVRAKALLFDVSFRGLTFFHYLEDLFQDTLPVNLYEETPVESLVIDATGQAKAVHTYVFSRAARQYRNGRHLREALRKQHMIERRKIGNTALTVLQLRQVVECAQHLVRTGKSLWKM
jgi:aminoglycoside N3'-acetyltransferase